MRDATDGYKQIGEFPARGMEPHDVALLSDGRTMVIANGGIRTHPDSGADELNLPDMKPSLVYVDITTGDLLEEQVLAPTCTSSPSATSPLPAAIPSPSVANIAGRKATSRRCSASTAAASSRCSCRRPGRPKARSAITSAR